jgi:hypothetical protein
MSKRVQFNVRLDKHRDLYDAIKDKADEQNITLNEFAIRAFQQALGWEVEDSSSAAVRRSELAEILAPMQQRLEEVEQRLGEARGGLLLHDQVS